MIITFVCKLITPPVSGDSAASDSDGTAPSSQWPLEKIDDSTLGVYNFFTLPVPCMYKFFDSLSFFSIYVQILEFFMM